MKHIAFYILVVTLGVVPVHAGEIYRHVDKDGNVVYSDQPSEGASKVEVDPINIDASPKVKPREAIPPDSQTNINPADAYSELAVTAPENDTTLRNTSEVKVSANLIPGLHTSHRVRFLDNGKVIAPPTRSLSLMVTGLNRGTHQITAEVIDAEGQVLITSAPIAVHVHKASILQPRPTTAP